MSRNDLCVPSSISRALLFALMLTAGRAVADEAPPAPPTEPPAVVPFEIVDAAYGGTGCPQGTASVVWAGNTISILFDEYVASTTYGDRLDRKSCNYAIALRVQPGYTVALMEIDYRGFADIPGGGFGRLRAEYFWAGQHGPVHTRLFPAGFFGDWIETDLVSGVVWSPCGSDVIARGNTSIIARKSAPYAAHDAEIAVDTADIEAGIVYYFEWDYC